MLEKTKDGYLLYIMVDGIQIKIDGWFKTLDVWNTKNDYYQWIGMRQ